MDNNKLKSVLILLLLFIIAAAVSYLFNGFPDLMERTARYFYPSYSLEIVVEGEGSVQPDRGTHEFTEGDTILIVAEPADDWEFSHWEGDVTGDETYIEVTIDTDKTVRAVFVPQ